MPGILDVLCEDGILVQRSASDWKEAVRLAGDLLVHIGAAEERYRDRMVAIVEELGPYILLGNGIAMPHARPEDGALRIGLCLVTLTAPVSFPNSSSAPVDLLVGLSAVDNASHLTVLSELAQVLEKPGIVDEIRAARTAQDVLRAVQNGSFAESGQGALNVERGKRSV